MTGFGSQALDRAVEGARDDVPRLRVAVQHEALDEARERVARRGVEHSGEVGRQPRAVGDQRLEALDR